MKAYIKNIIFNSIVEKMNVRQFPFFVRVIRKTSKCDDFYRDDATSVMGRIL